ncbi:hypothetical protein G7050_00610 [Dysgonomonas sp. HDW5A]|uniref:hypothetical protein n=1 Tax=Dysgonomonas sp. HDW5A TaxID=2714926 RepID=UPI00140A24EE|nr:hypothetical protein [Dysgonomonas sp. HDW5A]QIK58418.1 hypothetical protein G7050_00610 [Dysgonomonas sp. HDW5A]
MQNETKDQDYASLPDPLRSRKLKQKKTFNVDTLSFLNAFFILRVPRATGKVGNLTDDKLLRASAQVHQWSSRWLTSKAGVKLNVPIGNKFSLDRKLKAGRRATQHKAFLIPFVALGKRNTSNLRLRVVK